jgi:hypothetical protein
MILLIVVIAFLVVIVGSIAVGSWLQRKGSDIERGPKDP